MNYRKFGNTGKKVSEIDYNKYIKESVHNLW